MLELETINKLFLELAQFTSATTPREAELQRLNMELREAMADAIAIIGDIKQVRAAGGNSLTIVCDDPEAETIGKQAAIDVSGDFTDWKEVRYWGKDWTEALHRAANDSRSFNCKDG